MKKFLCVIVITVLVHTGCAQNDPIDYCGQTPPGDTAVVFAPGLISTPGNNEHTICFSPDGNELFFTRDPERTTYTTKFENGCWSKPAQAHFNGREAIFTPDGTKLYYNDGDIWRTEKINGEWKNPVRIPFPVSSDGHDYFASFTNDGVMYFSRFITGGQARIYRAELTDGTYNVVEDVGEPINHQAFNSYHPFIAPDESYIIFNSADRPDGFGGADLYICFKKDDNSWSSPINMGSTINSPDYDLCPIVTFDNNYLFFTRYRNGEGNIYWISSAIIQRLKTLSTDIKLNSTVAPKSIKFGQNYPNPFNPSTMITHQLKESNSAKLIIYETLGQEVKSLVDSFQSMVKRSIAWNGTDNSNNPVSSGVYLYSLITSEMSIQKKMVLVL